MNPRQLDAVQNAINIIDEYGGVIIADVVGLGKSVIASLLAVHYGKSGIIICPPNLQKSWDNYLVDFGLHTSWRTKSRGLLRNLNLEDEKELKEYANYDFIIVDEAHYFRNEKSTDYAALKTICNNKKVRFKIS